MAITEKDMEVASGKTHIAGTGRSNIGEIMARTRSFSERAYKGKLGVIRRKCPKCRNKKAFEKKAGVFCCKCGFQHSARRNKKK